MPATIEDLIISLEVEEEQAQRRGERARAEVRSILEHGRAEGRANLTPQETQDVERAQKTDAAAKTDLKGIRQRLEVAKRTKVAELESDEMLHERGPGGAQPLPDTGIRQRDGSRPAYDQVARIGSEERTYHRGNTGKGGPFIQDVVSSFFGRNLEAEQRLSRHMQEERVERGQYLERAAGTGAFAGLVVPQYLTEMYAPALSNLSPFADACNKHDLPESGMTVNISRITTPTSVALQASENVAVSNTDIDDTLLTENVQTAAGQQTLSRQAIERGTGVESVVMDDLFRRYAATKDSTLINQATTGLDAVSVANAYTDGTPTAAELWPKLLGAAGGVETALLGMGSAKIALMHPRRWYWLQSQLTTSFPMFSQPGIAGNASGTNNGAQYGAGARGVLPSGLVVVTDANIATTFTAGAGTGGTEDKIYVVDTDECHLWEDPNAPVFIRAEQAAAASLGVLLVLYGYFAYSFRRFSNAVQNISGTGLATPTF
jgi:hypothetical protein